MEIPKIPVATMTAEQAIKRFKSPVRIKNEMPPLPPEFDIVHLSHKEPKREPLVTRTAGFNIDNPTP